MKLFLCSDGITRPDLLLKLLNVQNNKKPKVAVINNAQDTYPTDLALSRGEKILDQFQLLNFETILINLREYQNKTNELEMLLKSCDLIWCTGGNVFWLRYVMKISGFDTIINNLLYEGITYGGFSAGALVTGTSLKTIELMDDPTMAPEIIWNGLGLVDFFIWPHWDNQKYTHLQSSAIQQMKRLPYESIVLKDGELIIIKDGQREIIKEMSNLE